MLPLKSSCTSEYGEIGIMVGTKMLLKKKHSNGSTKGVKSVKQGITL